VKKRCRCRTAKRWVNRMAFRNQESPLGKVRGYLWLSFPVL
jgi:hypothetical protein